MARPPRTAHRAVGVTVSAVGTCLVLGATLLADPSLGATSSVTTGSTRQADRATAPAPPVKISQNSSEAFFAGGGVACHFNGVLAENHWYRRFDLSGHYGVSKGFAVSRLVVAVEKAFSLDGTLPGHVAVSAIDDGDPLLLANLEPLASVPVDYESVADGALFTVPVTAVVPAGKDLVVEAVVQAGTDSELFRVGANTAPELADDYFRADVCGWTQPTPFTAVGWPMQSHILYAVGKAVDCLDAEASVTAAAAALAHATADLAKAQEAKTKAVGRLRKARSALKNAVAQHGPSSAQAVEARKKVAKAKKAKAAKVKALRAATSAAAAATAEVPASERSAALECAQPPLPSVQ